MRIIILRANQPGQAPEQRAIVRYDINAHKAKTEPTANKLLCHSQQRRALTNIWNIWCKRDSGIEIIIDATSCGLRLKVDAAAGWR